MNSHLELPFRALRFGLGLGAFLAGLDKFFDILATWEMYLSPVVTNVIPVSSVTFMHIVGVIEMIAGATILAGFTRLGGYLVAGWLLAVAASLVTTGIFYDLAVRDVVIAIAAFTLARMSEVRSEAAQPIPARAIPTQSAG